MTGPVLLLLARLLLAPGPGDAPPEGLSRLIAAYPEKLDAAVCDSEGRWQLRWKDSTLMPWDDGVENKSPDDLLEHPDLEDQVDVCYPAGRDRGVPPAPGHDPGRVRYEPFFRKMYGDSAREAERNLLVVLWLPDTANRKMRASRVNEVYKHLEAVSRDVAALPPEVRQVAEASFGTFNWRTVGGTTRLSAHAFGIAVDIGGKAADFWRWGTKKCRSAQGSEASACYRNRIPLEIVDAFERHGFIWGGKWSHFDTMHFEYRPELLPSPTGTPLPHCPAPGTSR